MTGPEGNDQVPSHEQIHAEHAAAGQRAVEQALASAGQQQAEAQAWLTDHLPARVVGRPGPEEHG